MSQSANRLSVSCKFSYVLIGVYVRTKVRVWPRLTNALSLGRAKFGNAPPRDLKGGEMPHGCSGGGGGMGTPGIDQCIS